MQDKNAELGPWQDSPHGRKALVEREQLPCCNQGTGADGADAAVRWWSSSARLQDTGNPRQRTQRAISGSSSSASAGKSYSTHDAGKQLREEKGHCVGVDKL